MKVTKKQLTVSIISIAILVASLVITLLDAFVPLDIWLHPALTFLFCLAVGFGVMTVVLAFIKQSPWHFFIAAVLIGLAFIYAFTFSISKRELWWISLIVTVTVWIIFALFSFIICGNRTESIALNKSPDYKNYKERQKEKEEEEKKAEKPELPELKSFK